MLPSLRFFYHKSSQRIELKALPHLRRGTRDGISCLAPVGRANQEINFISGGYDRTVRLWKVEERTHGTAVETIRVEHPSLIHTLAYNRKKNYIFSASNCDTRLWDLGKNQQMGKGKASNPIYQFHCIPEEPNLLVAEVCKTNPKLIRPFHFGYSLWPSDLIMITIDQAPRPTSRHL